MSIILIANSVLLSITVRGVKKVSIKKIGYSDKFLEPTISLGRDMC